MGGERFDTCQPEMYLFGENLDLNFLGGRPTPFPYTAPLPHEPTRTLRSLINIRKESLRFVKIFRETPSISLSNQSSITVSGGDHHTKVVLEPPVPNSNLVANNTNTDGELVSTTTTRQSSISSSQGHRSSTVSTNAVGGQPVTRTTEPTAPPPPPPPPPKKYFYNIDFTFDSDVKCAITINYFCSEEINSNGITYTSRDPSINSETHYFKRGANQQ